MTGDFIVSDCHLCGAKFPDFRNDIARCEYCHTIIRLYEDNGQIKYERLQIDPNIVIKVVPMVEENPSKPGTLPVAKVSTTNRMTASPDRIRKFPNWVVVIATIALISVCFCFIGILSGGLDKTSGSSTEKKSVSIIPSESPTNASKVEPMQVPFHFTTNEKWEFTILKVSRKDGGNTCQKR